MMKRHLLKTVPILLALLLCGCAHERLQEESDQLQPEEAPAEEEVRALPDVLSLPYVPDLTLDPITCSDGMQQVVMSLVCEGLFRLGPDFEPMPWLCEQCTTEDGLTYVLTLRDGVTFSDGTPLTGADVQTVLQRARSAERYQARLAGIAGITSDGTHVTITLSAPNRALPALLDIPICKAGTEMHPVGTGPYLFDPTGEWLVANQSWWRGSGRPTERIALVEVSDVSGMLYRFASRDVQMITADLTGTTPISATGDVTYLHADTAILQYLGCNTDREPLNDAAFRRCLSSGIDRTYLVNAVLSGHGRASQFPVSPASPLYPAALETVYSYDDFAAGLAQFSEIRPLTLLVNEENRFKLAAAQRIAESFTAAGVPVTVQALPWEKFEAALRARDYDLYYGEVKLTPDWNPASLVGTGGALNVGGWEDSRTDTLLALLTSSEERAAAMEQLCARLQNQAPIFPLCFKSSSVLIQGDVLEDLQPTASEPFYNLTDCTVHLRDAGKG